MAEKSFPGTRIAKVIARAGLSSRRDAEAAILAGRVAVNGKTIASPALNVTPSDKITIDGAPLPAAQHTRLWLYHKPKGLMTTERDPEGRQTVFETLPRNLPRVMSVGRLDINTEGLLLLTNDGGLKRSLELPATGWLRRYRVRAFGSVTQQALDALKNGIAIDGIEYGPIEAAIERATGDNVWLLIGIREGKNREIKKIAEHLGLIVNRLIRISYGPFQLRELAAGEVSEISPRLLKEQIGEHLIAESGARIAKGLPKLSRQKPPFIGKRPPRGEEGLKRRATAKAERYANWQQGGKRERAILRDEATQQLRLAPKTVQDRRGRPIAVGKKIRDRSEPKPKRFFRQDRAARDPDERRPSGKHAHHVYRARKHWPSRDEKRTEGLAKPWQKRDERGEHPRGERPARWQIRSERPSDQQDHERKTPYVKKNRSSPGREQPAKPWQRRDTVRKGQWRDKKRPEFAKKDWNPRRQSETLGATGKSERPYRKKSEWQGKRQGGNEFRPARPSSGKPFRPGGKHGKGPPRKKF